MFCIKIVCRLVQKQDIRLLKKKLSKKYLGSLAARKLRNIAVKAEIKQSQRSRNLLYLGIYKIKIMAGQKLLDRTDLIHKSCHLITICITHLHVDLIHSLFHSVERLKCARKDIPYGHSLFKHRMLVQIACFNIFRPFDLTLIRHKPACDNIHKCRLTFAICADKSDMFTLQKSERNIIKDSPVSETVSQVFNI